MLKSIKRFFKTRISTEKENSKDNTERQLQMATAALLVEMMHMDDIVVAEEIETLSRVICDKFSLTPEDASDLISMAEQERNDATDYHQFTSLINKNFTAQQKVKIIECLWRVAFADGALHEHEEHFVRKIAELIYVPHRAFINAKHRVLGG